MHESACSIREEKKSPRVFHSPSHFVPQKCQFATNVHFPQCPSVPKCLFSQSIYFLMNLNLSQSPTCPFVPKIPICPKVLICPNFALVLICSKSPLALVSTFPGAHFPQCPLVPKCLYWYFPKVFISPNLHCLSPQHAHLSQKYPFAPKCPFALILPGCLFYPISAQVLLTCPLFLVPIFPNAHRFKLSTISPNLHFSQSPTCPFVPKMLICPIIAMVLICPKCPLALVSTFYGAYFPQVPISPMPIGPKVLISPKCPFL